MCPPNTALKLFQFVSKTFSNLISNFSEVFKNCPLWFCDAIKNFTIFKTHLKFISPICPPYLLPTYSANHCHKFSCLSVPCLRSVIAIFLSMLNRLWSKLRISYTNTSSLLPATARLPLPLEIPITFRPCHNNNSTCCLKIVV